MPVSLTHSGSYVFVGCTSGLLVKIRVFDLRFPDSVTVPDSSLAITSVVEDGTFGYVSVASGTTVSIVTLHGSNATGARVGMQKVGSFDATAVGRFIGADTGFAYFWSSATSKLRKLGISSPPRTTVVIGDDGDVGLVDFNSSNFTI